LWSKLCGVKDDPSVKVRATSRLLVDAQHPPRTTHEFVLETLKRTILSGELPAGTRLIQADLAQQLNVSTTPVREALRDLVGIGLIEFDAHRGAVVKGIDLEELLEIYELRRLLEPYSIRRVAENITDEELDAAEALQRQMDAADDFPSWVDLNWQFHRLLEDAARMKRLQDMVQSVQNLAAIYVAHSLQLDPERMAEGNEEHRALLDALRARDGERAAEVLTQHLNGTLAAVLAIHEKQQASSS
jgi:DNA-binding GntR family transcriptional regulator